MESSRENTEQIITTGDGRRARSTRDSANRDGATRAAASAEQRSRDPLAVAKEHCLRLLTVRPRTRQELAQALSRKGIDDDVAEQVLARFDQVGLVDDQAFAEQWVRSRHRNAGLAKRSLVAELRRKGVEGSVAAEAAAELSAGDEEARARELVRRKLPGASTQDEQTKVRRLVGMLARKGYPEGLSYRVVREELAAAGAPSDLLDELPTD